MTWCRCVYVAHCDAQASCRLRAGATVNGGGGICGPTFSRDLTNAALRVELERTRKALDVATPGQDCVALPVGDFAHLSAAAERYQELHAAAQAVVDDIQRPGGISLGRLHRLRDAL